MNKHGLGVWVTLGTEMVDGDDVHLLQAACYRDGSVGFRLNKAHADGIVGYSFLTKEEADKFAELLSLRPMFSRDAAEHPFADDETGIRQFLRVIKGGKDDA